MKTIYSIFFFSFLISVSLSAENGSKLWLRYQPSTSVEGALAQFSTVVCLENGDLLRSATSELKMAYSEMTGKEMRTSGMPQSNSLLLGTLRNKYIRSLNIGKELAQLGTEGFVIRRVKVNADSCTVIASAGEQGVLYGAFHLLRLLQTNAYSSNINVKEQPSYKVRILNHWDNLDGTVERGYAGHSIWKWDELPTTISPRYTEYARANASIGINATVLNNVNASPKMLSTENLLKVKTIAAVLRPYNIRVYLSINFSSPKELGGLSTSDPLNPDVRKWWKTKAAEVYKLIPDFGGFLVKANSEGLPGPMDYGRTHVDGANMLADALKPFGGIVMWRAFVYEPGDDRVKLAYNEFHKFDGQFRDNVIIQVKNGPVDFQPREPFSPLFGAMKKTALMPELQITQEYLGQSNHLVFLSSMWEEFLDTDTHAAGVGTTISKLTTGEIYPQKITAFAGVANIGDDANWCGHHFAQANWYAFGRLAWNNQLSSEQIADEWIKMTFTSPPTPLLEERGVRNSCLLSIKKMMLTSHQTAVDYMMPLGLHHIFAWTHHYGPEPWCDIPGARPDWLPKYYHKADSIGLGFDRTINGSNAVSQYCSPLKEQFNDMSQCPEKYLLWFHHVPWDYRMNDGKTLWNEVCYTYDKGVQSVRDYQKIWDKAEPFVDAQRFTEVQSKLRIQARDAVWWKDACLLYFQTFSKQAIPYDIERPVHDLDSLKAIKLDLKHHN
jgi:alpha-glucuronidase